MPITKDDIRHIAALSRLELDPEELEQLAADLAQILCYVEQINLINTDNIIPRNRFVETENVFREDEVRPSLTQEEALANAPDRDKEYFRVPRVLG